MYKQDVGGGGGDGAFGMVDGIETWKQRDEGVGEGNNRGSGMRKGLSIADVATFASVARSFWCASWKALCSEKHVVVPFVL